MVAVKKRFLYKLLLSYALVVALSFGVAAWYLNTTFEAFALKETTGSLQHEAMLIQGQVSPQAVRSHDSASLQKLAVSLGQRSSARVTILSADGKVAADSQQTLDRLAAMENHAQRPEVREALAGRVAHDIRYSSTLGVDMLYVAVPIPEGQGIAGSVRLALPLKNVQHTLASIRATVILALIAACVLAFLAGSFLVRRITRPIDRVISLSRSLSQGDFSRRIYGNRGDDLGELAQAWNTMAGSIEEKIKQIKHQHQQLTAVFSSMTEGVIVVDKQGRIASLNPGVEKVFGVRAQDVAGMSLLEALRNTDLGEMAQLLLKEGTPVSREMPMVWPVQRIFQVNAAPIFEKEEVAGAVVVLHDITEFKRLETMRRDFVANVSHELKTPLTAIKGFVETLLAGAIEDKEHNLQFLKIIQDHTERLHRLVNDLLSLSALESRTAYLDREEFLLRGLVEKVISGFTVQCRNKGITVHNQVPAQMAVCADAYKLEHALTNLVDNAIKFNRQQGTVTVRAEAAGQGIKVIVEDTGPGIPQKDIPRIFERFYRVDQARSRDMGGTGLGLSIVKHVIELHGGTVGVESLEGAGASFWFILPARP